VSTNGTQEEGGRFDLIYRHHGLKVIALVLAAALWFLVVGEKAAEESFTVQLGIKGIPENMLPIGDIQKNVEVRLSGPRGFINNISAKDISATIDIGEVSGGLKEGVNIFRVNPDNIRVPKGIEVVKVIPSSIDIRLEKVSKAILPVKVVTAGKSARGYYIEDIDVTPDKVVVIGKKDELSGIKSIKTGVVDVSGITKTTKYSALLDVSAKAIKSTEPALVEVTVFVKKR